MFYLSEFLFFFKQKTAYEMRISDWISDVCSSDLDAWSWWGKAKGRYARGAAPRPGAVLVLSKGRRLRLGHLAVVAEVRNSREIVVHQANWLKERKSVV